MTQDGLARAAGISRASVTALEIGYWKPTLDTATRIAAALGCTLDDLVRDLGLGREAA